MDPGWMLDTSDFARLSRAVSVTGRFLQGLIFLQVVASFQCRGVVPQHIGPLSFNNFLMSGPKAYLAYSENVATGVRIGLEECHHQFQWERWNCPLEEPPLYSSNGIMLEASREMAFARAISSAGVTFTLTKNCSMGLVKNCGCQQDENTRPKTDKWKWGGCSHSYHFAERVSRVYVDGKDSGKDTRAVVSRHNNQAGREAVRRTMHLICKCHGVSGSCTTKTCWKQLSSFSEVGDYLKKKYRRAVLANFQNGVPRDAITLGKGRDRAAGISVITIDPGSIKPTSLVYIDPSPDYCMFNGTYRTLGRQCVRPKEGKELGLEARRSCSTLCRKCGLRVRRTSVTVRTSCDCKFYWCCSVKCNTCVEEQKILTCVL